MAWESAFRERTLSMPLQIPTAILLHVTHGTANVAP